MFVRGWSSNKLLFRGFMIRRGGVQLNSSFFSYIYFAWFLSVQSSSDR